MIIARNKEAATNLSNDFRRRAIKKQYISFVFGQTPNKFQVNEPIARIASKSNRWEVSHLGKPAETAFESIWSNESFSLLRIKPISGRTHQIRIHSAWEGFPIVGDPWYREGFTPRTPWQKHLFLNAKRLCLHAYSIEFNHPIFQAFMKFWCPLPQDFLDIVKTVMSEEPILPVYHRDELNISS
jgi:RluA family pseudouridine synthase